MRVTEGLRLCAMVATVSLLGAGAAHATTPVAHFKSNGANASHNSFNGTTAFDLNVTVNASGGTTSTFFAFETQTCNSDFSVCTGIFGNGTIPNSDFTVAGENANLNTNTAINPNFNVFTYIQDANGFNTTPAAGGIVTISWKKNRQFSTFFKGTSEFISAGFSHKNVGENTSDSANATGTLLGMPLPTTQASSLIGTNKSTDTIITRQ